MTHSAEDLIPAADEPMMVAPCDSHLGPTLAQMWEYRPKVLLDREGGCDLQAA